MCGRYFLRPSTDDILRIFDAAIEDDVDLRHPRYNIAPTQQVPAIFRTPLGDRMLGTFRWGLVPSWWKDAKLPTFLNARSETAHDKPVFRSAWRKRRCLVPASGFYEWRRDGKDKTPFAIGLPDTDPIALAGLWETWSRGEEPIRSLTILTTEATPTMRTVHDRMPVILAPEDWADWLDPSTEVEATAAMLGGWDGALSLREVGAAVGNVANTDGSWMTEP